MTYIEFFDRTASENIITCLSNVPDRVIFIGSSSKLMEKHIAIYKRIFSDRGYDIEFLFKTVNKNAMSNITDILIDIVETYDDCVFDITGGDDMFLTAMGIVFNEYSDSNIQMHRFNIRNNSITDCDNDGVTVFRELPSLSVRENIMIFGGDIAYGKTYLWDMSKDFKNDINGIWSVCRSNIKLWNAQIRALEAIEGCGMPTEDDLTVTADIISVAELLSLNTSDNVFIKDIMKALYDLGLITYYFDPYTVTVSYKNPQVKRCLTKVGQALEMKIFLAALECRDNEDAVYNDVMNGVVIDWDGEFHSLEESDVCDIENEIDVLMMHGIVPVFVSCKNGHVDIDELYKLNTVAERFGGIYAKKAIFATSLDVSGRAGDYFRQRAKDMNINVVENVQDMSEEDLLRRIKSLWCS